MFLLDTNIFLELLLDQIHADEAETLLLKAPSSGLHISEFSLYSIGIFLCQRKRYDLFLRFVDDLSKNDGIIQLRLSLPDMHQVTKAIQEFRLDFDDAYQYVTAKKYGLTLVSFDKDFDRTDRGRKTPGELL